ncbi:MAG: cobalamin-dependent protein, partial [Atribacterota bacterium]|nr:cobalamin-dependent protein [Atribacterota bacterium]
MNILFIYSLQDIQSISKPLRNFKQIQFGISYISSLLKKHGYTVKLLVLTRESKNKIIDEYISEFKPVVICFSVIFSEYEFIRGIAEHIKKHYPKIYLLAGGCHITLNPEECITAKFDAICVGEGEY